MLPSRATVAKPVSNSIADSDHLLVIPKRRTRTQEERDEESRRKAEEDADGAWEIAWLTGLRHSCKRRKRSDPPCRDSRHAGDVAAGKDALMALGLRPTPEVEARGPDLPYRKRQEPLKGERG